MSVDHDFVSEYAPRTLLSTIFAESLLRISEPEPFSGNKLFIAEFGKLDKPSKLKSCYLQAYLGNSGDNFEDSFTQLENKMWISNIKIKNFRNYTDEKIELNKNINKNDKIKKSTQSLGSH